MKYHCVMSSVSTQEMNASIIGIVIKKQKVA